MEFAHADGEAFVVSKMFDRIDHPPRGRDGGKPGASARVAIKGGKELKGMGREVIPAGATMVLETAGGGGRGDPARREPGAIADDRKNDLVS
jgi:N-methylhydantoinase B